MTMTSNRGMLFSKLVSEGWWYPPKTQSVDFSKLNREQLFELLEKRYLNAEINNRNYLITIPRNKDLDDLKATDLEVEEQIDEK